jgi:hypothetical protein
LRPYLIFEVDELPNGVPQSRLSELLASLKPFCRGVSVHLSARVQNYDKHQGTGLHAIGLSTFPRSGNAAENGGENFEHRVVELCIAAGRLCVMSFVLDVPNIELLRSARDFGVNIVSGSPIGLPLAVPAAVRRLSLREIEAASLKEPTRIALPSLASAGS